MYDIRDCQAEDVNNIASLWHTSWHSAHGDIVPAELVKLRTLDSFVERTKMLTDNIRVCSSEQVLGFSIIQKDELYQLYVAEIAQGTGLAQLLIDDVEAQIRANNYPRSWLVCAVGNERAAAFYRKRGWEIAQIETHELETLGDAFPLDCWRFEKVLK